MRDVISDSILGLKNGIEAILPKINQLGIIDIRVEASKKMTGILGRWVSLMMLDRRELYQPPKEVEYPAMARIHFAQEVYVGGTWRWLLDKPLLVGQDNGWRFYCATQLADAGTTLVCKSCKSCIKYYWPKSESDFEAVKQLVTKQLCPKCGARMSPGAEIIDASDREAYLKVTEKMAEFKHSKGIQTMGAST
jgi:hypothetical protein